MEKLTTTSDPRSKWPLVTAVPDQPMARPLERAEEKEGTDIS
jgi:hypothetical protein